MVAVLSIEKSANPPPENIIEQNLNTWVKASWDEFIQIADDHGHVTLCFLTQLQQKSN